MGTSNIFSFLLLVVTIHRTISDSTIYNICAFPEYSTAKCKGMEAGNSIISCVHVVDSVDCALKLQNGTADFGVFRPEHAVLASKSTAINENTRVISQVRHKFKLNDTFSFQAVVVVPTNYTGSLAGLRNKNFCQGLSEGYLTDRVVKHFERKVVPFTCFNKVSAVEEEVSMVSDFFNAACRPGLWAEDPKLNAHLKQTYKNLCTLCDSNCGYDLSLRTHETAALDCLTKSRGDVAYVSLQGVKKYFQNSDHTNGTSYQLLCQDGSTQSFNNDQPCSWVDQPWNVILARKDVSDELYRILNITLNPSATDEVTDWANTLRHTVLHKDHVAVATGPLRLTDHINRGGCDEESTGANCRAHVRWCTLGSDEKAKCDWLKDTALSIGLRPGINCISALNVTNCLLHISNNEADVVSIDTEYGHIARKVFNLSAVVYEEGDRKANYKIIAVIKASNQDITSFESLRRKKACFPEYRGLGWSAFVSAVRDINYVKCPDDFFTSACAPGAADKNHLLPGSVVSPKLCKSCPAVNTSDQCGTNQNNEFYGDLGAMQCLAKDAGHVAFVDYNRLLAGHKSELNANIMPSDYKVLCKNGSLSIMPGLYVDDNCALSIGIVGEMVGGSDADFPGVRMRDISELYLRMSNWLGDLDASKDIPMRMFAKFNGIKDLLFQDGTIGLVQNSEFHREINSYVTLVDNVDDDCRGSSNIITQSLFAFLVMLVCSFL